MIDQVTTILEPFVQRGLFPTAESAVSEMARDYVLRQIENYQKKINELQAKHGMTYDQFNAYLKARSATLAASPNPTLGKAIVAEEEDALDWKIAQEMLQNWLGIKSETRV